VRPDSSFCDNCSLRLTGPFCAACGQKAQPLNPTLPAFLHDFSHEMLHVDGKIFRTLRRLFGSPGFLTREYFDGRRARWISPIRLYLIFSVVYFALSSVVSTEAVRPSVADADEPEGAAAIQRLGFENEHELGDSIGHGIVTWAPRAMFLLVPLFAFLVHVAGRGAGRNYPQCLYFALHVHAAWFAMAALAVVATFMPSAIEYVVKGLLLVYGLTYVVVAFRRAFGGRMRGAVLRVGAVLAAYAAAVVATIAAIAAVVVLSGR
jgi:hypothetical protein